MAQARLIEKQDLTKTIKTRTKMEQCLLLQNLQIIKRKILQLAMMMTLSGLNTQAKLHFKQRSKVSISEG